jgi:hypothetical protein
LEAINAEFQQQLVSYSTTNLGLTARNTKKSDQLEELKEKVRDLEWRLTWSRRESGAPARSQPRNPVAALSHVGNI